ncbi:MAG: tRNA pseudouridine(38-40) synthase TruA, partial [Nitriliruptoraceae bacterium]|nr:tRNA pseudouridine(38-40) synthase TruA [Nitriliruptoraceae bacterium]
RHQLPHGPPTPPAEAPPPAPGGGAPSRSSGAGQPPVRLRIDLAYDGAPFAGFARQPDQRTVQGTLEDAIERLFGVAVATTCAGRTDRGVHALAQVVHLDLDAAAPRTARWCADLAVLRQRLDQLVGHAITVWEVRRVPSGFDARFSATLRGYRYRLVDGEVVDPIRRHDRWVVGEPLALRPMRAAAGHLIGEHDFASFCRKAPGRTTRRALDEVTLRRAGPGRIDVRLVGPAFCHQMVRAIVGCLVEVGRGRRDPDWLAEVLAARDRRVAARVAPPHGLTLERVGYGPGIPAAPPSVARALRLRD